MEIWHLIKSLFNKNKTYRVQLAVLLKNLWSSISRWVPIAYKNTCPAFSAAM